MALELSSLRKAVKALNEVLAKSRDSALMETLDDVTRRAVKSGAIQHFELTYELCWKFIKRWLEMNIGPNAAEDVTRRELFRHAAENRLIDDIEQWMRHHDARNRTSHAYDAEVAESIYQAAHAFAGDAVRLLEALEARND